MRGMGEHGYNNGSVEDTRGYDGPDDPQSDYDEAEIADAEAEAEAEHEIQALREQDEAGAAELDDRSDDPDWLGDSTNAPADPGSMLGDLEGLEAELQDVVRGLVALQNKHTTLDAARGGDLGVGYLATVNSIAARADELGYWIENLRDMIDTGQY